MEAHLAATVSTVRAYVALSQTVLLARSWNHEAGVVGFTTQRFPSKWVSGEGGLSCPVPAGEGSEREADGLQSARLRQPCPSCEAPRAAPAWHLGGGLQEGEAPTRRGSVQTLAPLLGTCSAPAWVSQEVPAGACVSSADQAPVARIGTRPQASRAADMSALTLAAGARGAMMLRRGRQWAPGWGVGPAPRRRGVGARGSSAGSHL